MSKLLLFVLLLVAIYYVRRVIQGADEARDAVVEKPVSKEVETMSECARCSVLVPRSEGVLAAGRFYCSDDHASLGPRDS